jgi:hypothetical protein
LLRSATDALLQMCRVSFALHADLQDGNLDFPKVVGAQFNVSRSDVFLKPVQLRGSGDRNNP